MTNEQYLDSIGVKGEARERCLKAMEKYQENHWWETDVDPRTFAYYQIKEPIMLCEKFSRLHKSAELLLGRPVYNSEFGLSAEALTQEAQRAWEGRVDPIEDRQKRVVNAIEQIVNYAEEHGGTVIPIQITEEEK